MKEPIKFTDLPKHMSRGGLSTQLRKYIDIHVTHPHEDYTTEQLYHIVEMEEFAKQAGVGTGILNTLVHIFNLLPERKKTIKSIPEIKKDYHWGMNSSPLDQWELDAMNQNGRDIDLDYYRLIRIRNGIAKVVDIQRRKVKMKGRKTKTHYQRSNYPIQDINGRKFIKIEVDQIVPLDLIKPAQSMHLV